MAFTADDIQKLMAGLDAALASGRLNAWQIKFVTDMRNRIVRYGTRTRLSDKQLYKLYEVIGFKNSREMALPKHRPSRKQRYWIMPRGFHRRRVYYRQGTPQAQNTGERWNYRVPVFAVIIAAVFAGGAAYAYLQKNDWPAWAAMRPVSASVGHAQPISRSDFRVTDGDTIHIHGEAKGMRLVGFNAPEVFSPRCAAERRLGDRATARLEQLLSHGKITVERVACSCPPGTEGTMRCNYARSCGILRVDGKDVGQTLVSEGLAVPFRCGPTSCPRTPRPWCH